MTGSGADAKTDCHAVGRNGRETVSFTGEVESDPPTPSSERRPILLNPYATASAPTAPANDIDFQSDRSADALAVWAERTGSARLVITPGHLFTVSDHKVMWSNEAADHFMEAVKYLSFRQGALTFLSAPESLRFDRGLKRASVDTIVCAMGDEGAGPKALASITRLDVSGDLLFGIEFRSISPRRIAADMVRALYPLTATELRIIAQFLQGFTVDEMAKKGAGSIETVRTHVRNIYAKLNVTSREAMFSKMIPFLEPG